MKKYYKKAFSVSEVIVAMMVFTVGILSVVEVFPLYRKLARISEKSSIASYLAQEKIENIFALTYEDIPTGQYESRHQMATSGQYAQYERQTDVSYIDGSYNNSGSDVGLKKISTTVYWDEDGREKSEQIVTLIADK